MSLDSTRADAVRKALDALGQFPAVDSYQFETGRDSTGDPAVWVFVVVNEDQIEALWPVWTQLRENIRDAIGRALGSEMLVYVRMWSRDDLDAQAQAGA